MSGGDSETCVLFQVVPVYAARKPMKPEDFPGLIAEALAMLRRDAESRADPLPADVREAHGLLGWHEVRQKQISHPSAPHRHHLCSVQRTILPPTCEEVLWLLSGGRSGLPLGLTGTCLVVSRPCGQCTVRRRWRRQSRDAAASPLTSWSCCSCRCSCGAPLPGARPLSIGEHHDQALVPLRNRPD